MLVPLRPRFPVTYFLPLGEKQGYSYYTPVLHYQESYIFPSFFSPRRRVIR